MKINILTIVLDGMPWIAHHLQGFNRLQCDWHWFIIEGAADNKFCTKWCQPQEPRLSNDGTSEYLDGLKSHPRISVLRKVLWAGKREMVNAPLGMIAEPGILLQVDADELWATPDLESLHRMFEEDTEFARVSFHCRYFIGPNVVTQEESPTRWLRAWRFTPGMVFDRHEPPTLAGNHGRCIESALTFDHMSYVLESQVAAKEKFYGYKDAVRHWRRLQENTEWPVTRLTDFLPWAGKNSSADLLVKPSNSSVSIMPTLDQIIQRNNPPPPVTASQAHKSRGGPFPKPLTRRFLVVIGFYDGDHEQAVALANLIYDLQKERSPDTDILFYHRNDARPMEPAIVEKMKLKFLRVFTHRCARINARGHPYGCNEMWYALIEMMRGPKWATDYYAFYNMEPDCVPLTPDWLPLISAEFRRLSAEGVLAVGHIKETPIRHLNGAAIYATEFYDKAGGLNLVGGNSRVGYDAHHAKRILPVAADTPIMGGRWGLATISEEALWSYSKGDEACVVFHGTKDDSAMRAVRKKWLATPSAV